jgi:hypothetical protein
MNFRRIVLAVGLSGYSSLGCGVYTDAPDEDVGDAAEPLNTLLNNSSAYAWGAIGPWVTCNSVWSCGAQSNTPGAVYCAGKTSTPAKPNGSGEVSQSKYWKPLVYCDFNCSTALGHNFTDADHIVTMPNLNAGVACGQQVTVCWGGKCTSGTVRDKSNQNKWELSHGITDALGAARDVTLNGVSISTGLPTTPTNQWPNGNAQVVRPLTLTWSDTGGATYYVVAIQYQSQGSWYAFNAPYTTPTNSLKWGSGFSSPTMVNYRWTVYGCNGFGCTQVSPYATFKAY